MEILLIITDVLCAMILFLSCELFLIFICFYGWVLNIFITASILKLSNSLYAFRFLRCSVRSCFLDPSALVRSSSPRIAITVLPSFCVLCLLISWFLFCFFPLLCISSHLREGGWRTGNFFFLTSSMFWISLYLDSVVGSGIQDWQ